MLKIAYHVNNLSDARYFSAWGFDWIIFDLDGDLESKISKVKEMAGWVEGVKIGLYIGVANNIDWNMCNESLDGIMLSEIQVDIPEELSIFYLNNTETWLGQISQNNIYIGPKSNFDVSLDFFRDLSSLDPKVDLFNVNEWKGIALKGGDEERIGVKDFDFFDEWLDKLINV